MGHDTTTTDVVSTGEAARRADVSYRMLNHWIHRGYLTANNVRGSGYPQTLSEDEVLVLIRMAQLVRSGYTHERAAVLARVVTNHEADATYVPICERCGLPVEYDGVTQQWKHC